MAGFTKTLSVTNAAYVAITANVDTATITVQEDPSVSGWPTTDYTVKKPTAAAVAIQKSAGAKYIFQKAQRVGAGASPYIYKSGEVAGLIQTVTGTTTFAQDESGT